MAGAIIIACGIGILLLILAGYVIVGGTLASADIMASAHKDMTSLKVDQQNTAIDITYADAENFYSSPNRYHVGFVIRNTGNTKIDFTKLGVVITMNGVDRPTYYKYGSGTNFEWKLDYFRVNSDCTGSEVVNPNQWDPGEYLCGWADGVPTSCGSYVCPPDIFYAFTGNGAGDYLAVT
jgi:archaellum component FlaG (FlaF/FlaG flagellin family)